MGKDTNLQGKEKQDEAEPTTAVLKVLMHCEACAAKVEKSLKGFQGVHSVEADLKNNKVTVKGKVDPQKICERIQKRCKKKAQLISPLPNKKDHANKPHPPKAKELAVTAVVLRVNMHCERCGEDLKRIILKIEGVQSVHVDFKNQRITVRGTMDVKYVIQHLHSKAKKQAEIIIAQETGADKNKARAKKAEASPPKYVIQHAHPPQLFSDDNPNACSIM